MGGAPSAPHPDSIFPNRLTDYPEPTEQLLGDRMQASQAKQRPEIPPH